MKQKFEHPKVFSENGNELFFDEQGYLIREEPKQEPCDNCNNDVCCCMIRTQETLEEAAENYSKLKVNKDGLMSDKQIKDFISGAKWQQTQDKNKYSEEEVLESANYLGFKQITSEELNSLPYQSFITDEDGNIWIIDKEKWFNKLKKK
jgi:hypothetical protein